MFSKTRFIHFKRSKKSAREQHVYYGKGGLTHFILAISTSSVLYCTVPESHALLASGCLKGLGHNNTSEK